jgi:hypothetical protein
MMTVTSESLKSLDPYIRPVNFSSEEELNNTQDTGVIISKLGPGQRIRLSAIAKLVSITVLLPPRILYSCLIIGYWKGTCKMVACCRCYFHV